MASAFLPAAPVEAATAYEAAASLSGQSISDFYAARNGQPLWLRDGVDPTRLLEYLRTADADGLDPSNYRIEQLAKAIGSAWGGSPDKVLKADMMLSEAFVAYVRDLKRTPAASMIWVDPELKPRAPSPRDLLEVAASAPSLER